VKKENPFISTVVEPCISVSEKTRKTVDTEETLKIDANGASLEVEKGNPDKTLNSTIPESGKKLGLENMNVAIDSTINMDVDEVDDENVVNNSVQPSLEKTNIRKDVGPDDIPLGQRYGESFAERLRSNSGKVVPSEAETLKKSGTRSPKSRIKTAGVGPKRWSSKVKVKTSAGRMRKRKVVSSSEFDGDVVQDVPNITPSTSRKSAGKKIVQIVDNVPIDKVSFNLPANALRWKY